MLIDRRLRYVAWGTTTFPRTFIFYGHTLICSHRLKPFYSVITEDKMIVSDLESRGSFSERYSVFDKHMGNDEDYSLCEAGREKEIKKMQMCMSMYNHIPRESIERGSLDYTVLSAPGRKHR